MSIRDLLSTPVQVLPPEATCGDAARLMRDENIGCVVVCDDEQPLGIVTDRDLVLRVIAPGGDPEKLLLRDVMSEDPIFVNVDHALEQVIATMRDLAIRRVPVVDAHGAVVGILSLDDVLLELVDQLGGLAEAVRAELSAA